MAGRPKVFLAVEKGSPKTQPLVLAQNSSPGFQLVLVLEAVPCEGVRGRQWLAESCTVPRR